MYAVAGCDLDEGKLAASRAEMPGLVYTRDGVLVASAAQEGLIRIRS